MEIGSQRPLQQIQKLDYPEEQGASLMFISGYLGTPTRTASSSLLSAGLKSIRLYRHICRMIPYLIKIHEMYEYLDAVPTGQLLSRLKYS